MDFQLRKIFLSGAIGAMALFAAACSSTPQTPAPAAATPTSPMSSAATVDDSGPVSLKIVSPTSGQVVTTTDVPVTFDLKNYHIEPNGQHIHVILDNEAYQPCYSTAEPFILKNVSPGIHTIRAFPSRAWHESIKEAGAFAEVTFYAEKKEGGKPVNFDKPLLTYSRPKGKYEGDKANKILFDFYLTNAELGPDKYQVKYSLDGQKPQFLDAWAPTYFENLTSGKHKLVVELVDKKGHPVKGAYNKTEREFEVVK